MDNARPEGAGHETVMKKTTERISNCFVMHGFLKSKELHEEASPLNYIEMHDVSQSDQLQSLVLYATKVIRWVIRACSHV